MRDTNTSVTHMFRLNGKRLIAKIFVHGTHLCLLLFTPMNALADPGKPVDSCSIGRAPHDAPVTYIPIGRGLGKSGRAALTRQTALHPQHISLHIGSVDSSDHNPLIAILGTVESIAFVADPVQTDS